MTHTPLVAPYFSTIEVTQFSYEVYKAFLEFLYTDQVTMEPEDAIRKFPKDFEPLH